MKSIAVVAVVLASLAGCTHDRPATTTDAAPAGRLVARKLDKSVTRRVAYDYLLYLPRNYDAGKAYPLVVFLHGVGERGTDVNKVKAWGPPKLVEAGGQFDFILVAPQCHADDWWRTDDLEVLLADVVGRYPVDRTRLYLTGLSMGGCGVWDWICRDPKTFAAAVPVCGYGNPVLARFSPIETAVWAFHGDADNVVPVEGTTKVVEALRKADRAEVKMTIYPGVKHDAWSRTYSNRGVYEWMLSKKRATPGEVGGK